MKSSVKSGYHHGNLKAALLDAAREIITKQGFEALTLRAVADVAGVSRTAVYRHFEDKAQLVGMVCVIGFQRLHEQLQEQMQKDTLPLDKLRNGCRAYVRFAQTNPAEYSVMFSPEVHDRGCPKLAQAAAAAFAVLVDGLLVCQQAGVIKPQLESQQALVVWAAIHGLVSLCRDQAPSVVPDATLDDGLELMLDNLLQGMQS